MSNSDLSSDSDENISDQELQEAFAEGRLKTGLNKVVQPKRPLINNVSGMTAKLADFKCSLPWIERLDVTCDPAPATPGTDIQGDDDVHNDFKRELTFYRQAQATVLQGIKQLQKLGVSTRRPEDFFAQMAKSDDHMGLVRKKLLEKQMTMDRSEKAKKLRELRKYGKKVQTQVMLQRQKDKREIMDAVKKYRKGHKDKLDFLDDKTPGQGRQQNQTDKNRPNRKREYKNKKFGHGGQKKRSKFNTAKSAADMSEFNPKVNNNKKPTNKKGKPTRQGKSGIKPSRPGKSKRQKAKNRK